MAYIACFALFLTGSAVMELIGIVIELTGSAVSQLRQVAIGSAVTGLAVNE